MDTPQERQQAQLDWLHCHESTALAVAGVAELLGLLSQTQLRKRSSSL